MSKDGNGEIDQGEMEEVFSKLCRIVNCEQQEVDINFFLHLFDLLFNSGRGSESRRVKQVQRSRGERASADDGAAHATASDAWRQVDQQEAADEEEDEGDEEEAGQREEVSARGNDHLRIPNRRRSSIQL